VDIIEPNQKITIPQPCGNSLQCIPPQQSASSAIYIPNVDNSGFILLEVEGKTVRSYNITVPCVFNDFVLLSSHNDHSLLISCALMDDDPGTMKYTLTNRHGDGTVKPVAGVTAVVSPIILTIPRPAEEGGTTFAIASISNQHNIVTFEVTGFELDVISANLPCVPTHIRRQRLDDIFFLTCEDGKLHRSEDISTRPPINFNSLPNFIKALANNGRYSLAITLTNSTATVTIQEVTSKRVATRTIQLNTTVIYAAGFGPDDKFAYVANDQDVTFINVAMALSGTEEFKHIITSQLCSQCPPVVFLNNNIVMISSSITIQVVSVEFYQLWPPQQFLSRRILNKQPVWYWFTPYVVPTTVSPTAGDNNNNDNGLSHGTIAGIIIGIIAFMAFAIIASVVFLVWYKDNKRWAGIQSAMMHPVAPQIINPVPQQTINFVVQQIVNPVPPVHQDKNDLPQQNVNQNVNR